MHNAISISLTAKWLGWFSTHGNPTPSCNCDSEDVGISEDLLSGMVIYYTPTNGGIGEHLQSARVWHIQGSCWQEARGLERDNNQHVLSISWHLVWGNLPQAVVTGAVTFLWYMSIHDLVPPNVRLHSIRIKASDACSQCGAPDTLLYRQRREEPA